MAGILQFLNKNMTRALSVQRGRISVFEIAKMSYSNKSDTSEEMLTSILKRRFPKAKDVQVTDVSGGCGAMYEIYVETEEFKGLNLVKQHRTITDILKEEIKLIHGLRITTKIP